MTTPALEIPIAETKADLCWNLPVWLVLICNVTAFFAWTAWTAAANRPNAPFSYTANWPHDDLIGNQPPAQFLIWSIVSVIVLIGAIATFIFIYLRSQDYSVLPTTQTSVIPQTTASQKITSLFFVVAMALFLIQIGAGMITAHYAVEGESFYGLPLQQFLPYAASRTWHLQLAVFWIATCWLAAGLYFAPRFGREPQRQDIANLGLLIALAVVVGGAMVGSWASIQGILGNKFSFWWGHQGYEYVELGRVWQLLLIGGMVFWLWLMYRALQPALKQEGSRTGLNHSIVLYYSQAINTTPIHAHSALFGVYGSLAIALMLFPLREMTPESAWNEKLLRFAFWSINGGLVAMLVFGLIPSGFYQLVASVNYGTWYARSAALINSPWMHWTVWLRMPGDLLFSLGAVALFIFTLRAVISIFRRSESTNKTLLPSANL